MSNESFERFRETVFANESMRDELLAIEDRSEFIDRVVAMAQSQGYDFTHEDVITEMRVADAAWVQQAV